ncbi:hypothetical protein BSQ33_08820 [Vibrio gazogenes]|uniref:Uncharacterized protein n=1 Tax=Vibrio gazogenes TaxID=687 RepID=A0A1Z2SFA5_VIBGA|nr:hypothetical protein BSQ33_08820 [Vibrio gazogenes]
MKVIIEHDHHLYTNVGLVWVTINDHFAQVCSINIMIRLSVYVLIGANIVALTCPSWAPKP